MSSNPRPHRRQEPGFADKMLKSNNNNHVSLTRSSLETSTHLGMPGRPSFGSSVQATNSPPPYVQIGPLTARPSIYTFPSFQVPYDSRDLVPTMNSSADLHIQSGNSVPIHIFQSAPSLTTASMERDQRVLLPTHALSRISLDPNMHPPIPPQVQHHNMNINDRDIPTFTATGRKMAQDTLSDADLPKEISVDRANAPNLASIILTVAGKSTLVTPSQRPFTHRDNTQTQIGLRSRFSRKGKHTIQSVSESVNVYAKPPNTRFNNASFDRNNPGSAASIAAYPVVHRHRSNGDLADRFASRDLVTQMSESNPHAIQSAIFRGPFLRSSQDHISIIPELHSNMGLSPNDNLQHHRLKTSRSNLLLSNVPTNLNLNPDMFVYQSLDYSENRIRLLRLHPRRLGVHVDDSNDEINCDIIHTCFTHHPAYNALSYTWGDPNGKEHTIKVNGRAFKVKENLHQALRRLRSGFHDTYLWIDAICINQDEKTERNHQVGIMRTIYERAEKVLVWLGNECENSHNALLLAEHLYNYRQSEEDLAKHVFTTPDIALYFKALKELFARSYWRRIWVVQEITVAKDVLVICGSHSVSLQILIEAQKVMSSEQGQRALALQPLEDNIWSQIIWNGPSSIHASRAGFLEKKLSLYEAVQYHYQKGASDPRDKLFALMGLSNDASRHTLEIDYSKPVREVYHQFAKCEILNTGRLDIVTKVQYNPKGSRRLQSWVPDWTFNKKDHVRLQNIRRPDFHYRAGGNTRARVEFIPKTDEMRMMGVRVGTITHLGDKTNMCNPEDWKPGTIAIREWGWLLIILAGKRGEKIMSPLTLEQFARTLLCNHVTAESVRAGFLKTLLGAIAYLILSLFPGGTLQSVLMEYCHDEIISKPEERRMTHALNVALNAQEYIWDRRFFLTDRNQMGMAPQETEEGDVVVIPLGCSGPVVLRLCDGRYRVVGECYVDGVMYGEVMENMERSGFKVEPFLVG
ncbi:hypothetical protein ACMFMF_009708 [Clarireedia jacksonii]